MKTTKTKTRAIWLAAIGGLGTMLLLLGLLGTSPAHAQGIEETATLAPALLAQGPGDDDVDWIIVVVFTDPVTSRVTDLSGNEVGEAIHEGKVKCNRGHCSQKTQLTFGVPLTDPLSIEYKFSTTQAFDPEAERAVIAGVGKITGRNQKARFSFTATLQNERDGTVWIRYEASRPDASFIVPASRGTFTVSRRR